MLKIFVKRERPICKAVTPAHNIYYSTKFHVTVGVIIDIIERSRKSEKPYWCPKTLVANTGSQELHQPYYIIIPTNIRYRIWIR